MCPWEAIHVASMHGTPLVAKLQGFRCTLLPWKLMSQQATDAHLGNPSQEDPTFSLMGTSP